MNGVAISGATSDKFTPTSVLAGKNISVKVQYTDALGVKASSNDCLSGGMFASELHGYAGNDVLHGDSGDDTLYGGIGNDVLQGADDNDRLSGDRVTIASMVVSVTTVCTAAQDETRSTVATAQTCITLIMLRMRYAIRVRIR